MERKYVSRAGVKLEAGLKHFEVDVGGKVCLDVGAATGGFTDCLLQHGAARVYAVETGRGQLAWRLRQDPRVVVLEQTNILYEVSMAEKVDVAVVDTSWTKLKLAIPATSRFVKPDGTILALVKPQYEARKSDLRRGVVKDEKVEEVVAEVRRELVGLGLAVSPALESPVTGDGGNREFLVKIDLNEAGV